MVLDEYHNGLALASTITDLSEAGKKIGYGETVNRHKFLAAYAARRGL